MSRLIFAASSFLLVSSISTVCGSELEILSGRAMGTSYTLKLASRSEMTSIEAMSQVVKDELERIEAIFSLYRAESEISRWNAAPELDWVEVSEDFYAVTKFAIELSQQSQGAFDPTIRPLIELWKLNSLSTAWHPPTMEAIRETRKQMGAELIELQTTPLAIRKRSASIKMDLNALVEGWAIERIVSLLLSHGFENALFELGGEFGAIGDSGERSGWCVGLEDPKNRENLISKVTLRREALCTSGSTKQWREHGGRRYSHIIDPRTGYPIDHDVASVSLLHTNAMVADGWSTALLVLGPKDGELVAETVGLAASFVIATQQPSQMNVSRKGEGRFPLIRDEGNVSKTFVSRFTAIVIGLLLLAFVLIALRWQHRLQSTL